MKRPHTVAELLNEATKALVKRDPQRLEELERISEGWLQTEEERISQYYLLHAMAEAAELLLDTPSDMEHEMDDEDEDA